MAQDCQYYQSLKLHPPAPMVGKDYNSSAKFPTAACTFCRAAFNASSETAVIPSYPREPPRAQNYWKTQHFAQFSTFQNPLLSRISSHTHLISLTAIFTASPSPSAAALLISCIKLGNCQPHNASRNVWACVGEVLGPRRKTFCQNTTGGPVQIQPQPRPGLSVRTKAASKCRRLEFSQSFQAPTPNHPWPLPRMLP